jgi:hypothetical protein
LRKKHEGLVFISHVEKRGNRGVCSTFVIKGSLAFATYNYAWLHVTNASGSQRDLNSPVNALKY